MELTMCTKFYVTQFGHNYISFFAHLTHHLFFYYKFVISVFELWLIVDIVTFQDWRHFKERYRVIFIGINKVTYSAWIFTSAVALGKMC